MKRKPPLIHSTRAFHLPQSMATLGSLRYHALMKKLTLIGFCLVFSFAVQANDNTSLIELSVQDWLDIAAKPDAQLVGSSISGISSAFAASLAHKACLLSAKRNKSINWEALAETSLSLQAHFINTIQKDKLAFTQYLQTKNDSAARHNVQVAIADNFIQLMDYNMELLNLSEQALPHSNIFLESDFLIVCQLAKAGFYGAHALLDSDLKTFKNFPQATLYQKQASLRIEKISKLKAC